MDPEKKILVCGYTASYPDDIEERCADGGEPIYRRPHSPANTVKLCLRCALCRIKKDGGDATIEVSEKTKQEVREFFSAEKN